MSQVLILSDCHGNKFGLQAVLEAGGSCDAILCLGDIVGYGAHPNECCEILQEAGAVCLMGNHDAAALGILDDEWFNSVAQFAVRWTRQNLSRENSRWLQGLEAQVDLKKWNCEGVHASLVSPLKEYLTNEKVAAKSLKLMKRDVLFCGHTHQAMVCTADAPAFAPLSGPKMQWELISSGAQVDLDPHRKLSILNPGSCGQPRDGNPLAKALIYNSETFRVEFLAVPYDVQAARQAILDADLPSFLGERLLYGR